MLYYIYSYLTLKILRASNVPKKIKYHNKPLSAYFMSVCRHLAKLNYMVMIQGRKNRENFAKNSVEMLNLALPKISNKKN